MRRLALFCLCSAALAAGCSSLDLPTVEESRLSIERARPVLEKADATVRAWSAHLPSGSDVVTRVRLAALNRLLGAFAGQRADDVKLGFLPTRPLVKEDKQVLGISYSNTLDIDGGDLTMNLRTFRFDKFDRNSVEATIEIEGKGKISASGRYLGVPAGVSPTIELRLAERVSFDIKPADSGMVLLQPRPKTVMLHAKLGVQLLQWSIPWSQDIPLQLTELIQPVKVPVAISPEVPFPVPASKAGDDKVEYVPFKLQLSKTSVNTTGDVIELKTDIDFKRK